MYSSVFSCHLHAVRIFLLNEFCGAVLNEEGEGKSICVVLHIVIFWFL